MLFSLVLVVICLSRVFFFFKQKTAYEMRISDWSSDVCSSDLVGDWRTKKHDDQWTVSTLDGSLSAHFEHTIAITGGEPEVLTLRSDEQPLGDRKSVV